MGVIRKNKLRYISGFLLILAMFIAYITGHSLFIVPLSFLSLVLNFVIPFKK